MREILILNGPNLNLLGTREPSIYGAATFESCLEALRARYRELTISYVQSNHEGDLIDALHRVGFGEGVGVVLNAGAYTHTSIALRDAISAISTPVVEVHISNVHSREVFRHESKISAVCCGTICGFGLDSYRLGIEALLAR